MTALATGSRLGEYRIESLERSTAAGSFYRATQEDVLRRVTLVVAGAAAGSEEGGRFAARAQRLAALDHPHVLPVYDVREADGQVIATERSVAGRTLADMLAAGRLAPERAAALIGQLAAVAESVPELPLAPAAISVVREGAEDRVYLSALTAALEAPGEGSSTQQLARLLAGLAGEGAPALAAVAQRGSRPGGFDSPSALAAAAAAAVAPTAARRRRVGLLAAAGAAAVVAVVAAIALLAGGDESPPRPATAPAGPAAREVATIPLGAAPYSIAFAQDSVWVATTNGTILRVDPRAERVVGAPIRFAAKPSENSNITLRAGADALFVLDGAAGRVTRIDLETRRITRRAELAGYLHGAAVADNRLWITRSLDQRAADNDLIRLDLATLERRGRAFPVGSVPEDIEVVGGIAWVTGGADGSLTRVTPDSGEVDRINVTSQGSSSAVLDGRVWMPDVFNGLLVAVDAETMEPSTDVVRAGFPFAVTAAGGSLWQMASTRPDPESPVELHRIDPRSGRALGEPLRVSAVGWPYAGLGALWIMDREGNALRKLAAVTPVPGPRPPPAARPGELRGGPLAPGRWQARTLSVPFELEVPDPGWLSVSAEPHDHSLTRFDTDERILSVFVPAQLFAPDGGVERLREPEQVLRTLERVPRLRVSGRTTTSIGGATARTIEVEVIPSRIREFPPFCSEPCVPLFAAPGATWTVGGAPDRLHVLRRAGRTIVVLEERPPGASFAATTALLRTLRWR